MINSLILVLIIAVVPTVKGGIPGTFFWKPRLGLDLAIPTTEGGAGAGAGSLLRSAQNIRDGYVVLVDGYQIGITVISFAACVSSASTYPHINPLSGYFYTNVYRWALRYFSLIPFWMGGNAGNFVETHKVWKRRYHYMDEFLPKWVQFLLFYVKKEEWEREEWEHKRFKQYSEPAFGKHYRYPTKIFNNWKSQMTKETIENFDSSSS